MTGTPQQPNQVLLDAAKRAQIVGHDPKLVVWTTPPYFDGDTPPTPIPTFNRGREVELGKAFLANFSDQAFADEHVTVQDMATTVYGSTDTEFVIRLIREYLTPRSALNKITPDSNGNSDIVFVIAQDGVHIIRENRKSNALRRLEDDLVEIEARASRANAVNTKKTTMAMGRLKRVAPNAVAEARELTANTAQRIEEQTRRALGLGE